MIVKREEDRPQALLVLTIDLRMPENGAASLLAEADERPGRWRRSGSIKVRKNPDGTFSVRG